MSGMYHDEPRDFQQTDQIAVMSLLVVSWLLELSHLVLMLYHRVTRPCSFRPHLSRQAKQLVRKRLLRRRRRRPPCETLVCSWYSGSNSTV
jgi:hypothetical protein